QLDRLDEILPRTTRPLFTFLNVAAVHQPNRHYLPGATTDTRDSHAAALEYVDTRLDRLFTQATGRGRPVLVIICSDHGTAYGEDGHTGHRLGHEVVWTVPYAHFVLPATAG
ncbi:MAG: sulfatase-like hydrolase/transferase, partial [Actinoplanes sp.]